ncbi:hypothetical protein Nepgr_022496 [Nepenthes gracilis]|uniref:Uncharacterized protein n=1 Tax=Nepenthes gracilis TaxID=150966 RepID=A0AAD3XY89_NEPGR|nr:hypothetical protein Nepgr_022496 [Nepenthes gracilis]
MAVVVDKSMVVVVGRSKAAVVGSNKLLDSSTAAAVGRNMVVVVVVVVGRRTMGEVHMPFLSKPGVCVRMNLRSSEQGEAINAEAEITEAFGKVACSFQKSSVLQ